MSDFFEWLQYNLTVESTDVDKSFRDAFLKYVENLKQTELFKDKT